MRPCHLAQHFLRASKCENKGCWLTCSSFSSPAAPLTSHQESPSCPLPVSCFLSSVFQLPLYFFIWTWVYYLTPLLSCSFFLPFFVLSIFGKKKVTHLSGNFSALICYTDRPVCMFSIFSRCVRDERTLYYNLGYLILASLFRKKITHWSRGIISKSLQQKWSNVSWKVFSGKNSHPVLCLPW